MYTDIKRKNKEMERVHGKAGAFIEKQNQIGNG